MLSYTDPESQNAWRLQSNLKLTESPMRRAVWTVSVLRISPHLSPQFHSLYDPTDSNPDIVNRASAADCSNSTAASAYVWHLREPAAAEHPQIDHSDNEEETNWTYCYHHDQAEEEIT
jgi:hypothetical protein